MSDSMVDPAVRLLVAEAKIKAMTEERDIWIFNAKMLQKGYNELDAKLREAQEEIDRLKAWGVPTKGEGK